MEELIGWFFGGLAAGAQATGMGAEAQQIENRKKDKNSLTAIYAILHYLFRWD